MSTLLTKVNIGTVAGDGTGDPLRTAMGKVNDAIERANVLTHQMNTISYIGDSILNYGYVFKFAGVGFLFMGSNAPALTEGDATFEFRASDGKVRWTAPGDTAGPWTTFVEGINVLQSGSPNKWSTHYLPLSLLDTQVDYSETNTLVANEPFGFTDRGLQNWTQILSGQRLLMLGSLGVIGNTTKNGLDRVHQLYEIDSNGLPLPEGYYPKIVVIYLGVNDFYNNINHPVEDSINNIRQMRDYIVSRGSYPVVCTIPEVDPWVQEFNRGLRQMALEDHRMILADLMNAVRDPLLTDGTMLGGETDLHFNNYLAFLAGREVYNRITPYLNGWGVPTSRFGGDIYNICRNGALLGDTGTLTAGVTGDIADDFTIEVTGTLTVVAAKVNSSYDLPWQQMVCSAAGEGDQATLKLNAAAYTTYATLASMGLVVCDKVYADVEFESLNIVNLRGMTVNLAFYNGVTTTYVSSNFNAEGALSLALPPEHNVGILRTPLTCVPTGTTHVSAEIIIIFKAGGSGDFKVRCLGITNEGAMV